MIVTADGMGMITVEWWQLGVIGVGVFFAVLIADRISARMDERREARQDTEHGPYPCLKHLGTEPDGFEWWCWNQHGHDGPHLNQWGVEVDTAEYVAPATIADTAAEDPMHSRCLRSALCSLKNGHEGICYLESGDQCTEREYPDGHRCLLNGPHPFADHHYGHWPEAEATEVNANGDVVVPGVEAKAPTLCTYGEDGEGNPDGCWKPAGHDGAHMILGQGQYGE